MRGNIDQKAGMRSFRLHRPPCPACGSTRTGLAHGVWTYAKLAAAALCAGVLNTVWPRSIGYRCCACGERFEARFDPD